MVQQSIIADLHSDFVVSLLPTPEHRTTYLVWVLTTYKKLIPMQYMLYVLAPERQAVANRWLHAAEMDAFLFL